MIQKSYMVSSLIDSNIKLIESESNNFSDGEREVAIGTLIGASQRAILQDKMKILWFFTECVEGEVNVPETTKVLVAKAFLPLAECFPEAKQQFEKCLELDKSEYPESLVIIAIEAATTLAKKGKSWASEALLDLHEQLTDGKLDSSASSDLRLAIMEAGRSVL